MYKYSMSHTSPWCPSGAWRCGGGAVEWSGRSVECIWRRVKRDGRVDGHGEGTYLPTYLAALDDLIWERGNLPGASSSLHLCLI